MLAARRGKEKQTADHELFVRLFMAATVSALNPARNSQNCLVLVYSNE